MPRRSDADLVRDVPGYRRLMPALMRGRNESAAYFTTEVDLAHAERILAAHNADEGSAHATLFHFLLWSMVRTLAARPRLNRFVAGGRFWQRRGIWISFAAKRSRADDAPLVVVKLRFSGHEELAEIVEMVGAELHRARDGRRLAMDREVGLLARLPPLLLRWGVALVRGLDALGLLPRWFIEGDPFFCSVFVANLGSVGLAGAYHHLYEYGSCSIFCVVGRAAPRAVLDEAGRSTVRRILPLQFTFDERIEDGSYAARALGELRERIEQPRVDGPAGAGMLLDFPPAATR